MRMLETKCAWKRHNSNNEFQTYRSMMAINGATIDAAHPALSASAATRDGKFLVFHFEADGVDNEVFEDAGLGRARVDS